MRNIGKEVHVHLIDLSLLLLLLLSLNLFHLLSSNLASCLKDQIDGSCRNKNIDNEAHQENQNGAPTETEISFWARTLEWSLLRILTLNEYLPAGILE